MLGGKIARSHGEGCWSGKTAATNHQIQDQNSRVVNDRYHPMYGAHRSNDVE